MDKSCPIPESFNNMIWNILVLTLLFFLTFISRFIFAPLIPEILPSLKITQAQAGSIFLFASLGGFVGSFGSGLISSRLKHKWTMVLALLLAGIALISLHFTASLAALRGTTLVLGFAAGALMPSVMATLTAIVSRQDWGKALAVQQMGPPLALVLGPLLSVVFLGIFAWTSILVGLGGLVITVAVLFAIFSKVGGFPGDPPSPALIKTIFGQRSFWLMIVLFALGMGGQVGIYTMLPLYMITERGLSAETANSILGVSQLSALFMTFISGWITDRIGEKRTMAIFLAISGVITVLIGTMSGLGLKIVVFLQPALIVCFFPPGFAALSRIIQPNLRSLATAFGPPLAFIIGGGLLPAFLGYMGSSYSLGLGIAIAGGLMIVGAVLVVPLQLLEKLDDGC